MQVLSVLLFILASASAQTGVSKLLEQGMLQAVAGLAPIPAKDKADVLTATATLLAKHVTFRPDGTASSFYTQSGRRPVESFQLQFFTPGPGPSIAEPERTGKDAGLPPGMTRGK